MRPRPILGHTCKHAHNPLHRGTQRATRPHDGAANVPLILSYRHMGLPTHDPESCPM